MVVPVCKLHSDYTECSVIFSTPEAKEGNSPTSQGQPEQDSELEVSQTKDETLAQKNKLLV